MKKIEIQLNQEYRSFSDGFKTILEGDLVILSGINGSGKTQLFDIIRGFQRESRVEKINRSVQIDRVSITEDQIVHRSIRDYSSVSDLTQGSARIIEDHLNNLWNWYTQYNLNPEPNQIGGYQDSCKRARDLLIEKIGQDQFNKKNILRDDFNKIFEDFVLYHDDIFTNKIGEIFFRFTTDREQKIIDIHNNEEPRFDESTLPPAPWTRLNELLDKLKFGYKFKSNYKNRNHALSEQPALFAVNSDGTINETERRTLQDLSDGEKAIISLTFAMLASEDIHPKILILDEYDAPLNPSLINAFFFVLKDFFIDKGVQVILATHSPATLSLAPNYAFFYEVFKKDIIQGRLLKVEREQYTELKVANQRFVDRIDELQDEIITLNEKIQTGNNPLIVTEGKTDIKHLKKSKVELDIDCDIEFHKINENWGDSVLKTLLENLARIHSSRKIIGIFDRDVKDIVKDIEKDSQQYKDYGNNVYAFCIPKPEERESYKNISIEFYYSDIDLKKQKDGRCLYFDNEINFDSKRKPLSAIKSPVENLEKKIWDENIGDLDWIHSKTKFAKLVETDDEFTKDFDFSNFSLIFNKIKSIINPLTKEDANKLGEKNKKG